jgi:trans-2,3-dihydro-3-hydroxyanthranilate isomerase
MARSYRYLLLDVFTEMPLKGNPLAVFLDADGLTDAEMQAIARETNLSETTFCFPGELPGAEDARQGVRVRIFTTQEELPFAGHPTLGTAAALRSSLPALCGATVVRLRLQAGVVPVRFRTGEEGEKPGAEKDGALPFGVPCFGEMEQPRPWFGQRHAAVAVAAALGAPVEALDAGKPVQTVSTGIPFVIVPLSSAEALRALRLPLPGAAEYLRATDGRFFYLLAPGEGADRWRARMPLYAGEDPATGSAAGCAAAYLVEHGFAHAGAALTIEQGVEMGRGSLLYCSAAPAKASKESAEGHVGTWDVPNWETGGYVRVGGSTVLVADGRFFLP